MAGRIGTASAGVNADAIGRSRTAARDAVHTDARTEAGPAAEQRGDEPRERKKDHHPYCEVDESGHGQRPSLIACLTRRCNSASSSREILPSGRSNSADAALAVDPAKNVRTTCASAERRASAASTTGT